ncbi:short-chain dehydrogenase [Paenibacillus sp. WLX2291]|uniref:short-chain dehydrogenase n=1 Tax=Paenibacillus sp. WLX2291 TaxID=3296934 RepID=UPI0039845A52
MKHALVIGGSGMLAQTSLWLADQDYFVSIIGRNVTKLKQLSDLKPNITSIPVDYSNEIEFRNAIKQSITANGSYDLVVAWIHGNGQPIIHMLDSEIKQRSSKKWKLFHVLGSGANVEKYVQSINQTENYAYYQIQLGFVIEPTGSRWLTNTEIASGVMEGIMGDSNYHLVGTLTPWSQKP